MQGKVEKDCKNAKTKKEEVKGYPIAALDEFMVREDWLRLMPVISGDRRESMAITMKLEEILEPLSVLPETVCSVTPLSSGKRSSPSFLRQQGFPTG